MSMPKRETLTLSKRIPARRKTVRARWCLAEFLEMSPQFRAIRKEAGRPMDNCYWCNHPFADGEMMGLAAFEDRIGNKILCQTCAMELLNSKGDGASTDAEAEA